MGERAAVLGVVDDDWVQVTSHHGRIKAQVKLMEGVNPDTVWTWNAIGKRRGAWRLDKDAPEGREGFLLNHLISDLTPRGDFANADPVTGQAAWFDLRVSIRSVAADGAGRDGIVAPQFASLPMGDAPEGPLRYGAKLREEQHG